MPRSTVAPFSAASTLFAVGLAGLLAADASSADTGRSSGGSSPHFIAEFYGQSCPPCKAMMPMVDRLISQGADIRKVCTDYDPAKARRYNITSVPTLIVFVDNKEVERVVGSVSESRLRQMLAKLPKPSSRAPERARPARSQPKSIFVNNDRRKSRSRDAAAPIFRANLDAAPESSSGPNPMDASVRLSITEDGMVEYATGTIIESRPGRSVIATCGHLFRGHESDVEVVVEFFRDGASIKKIGQCLAYKERADVGLIVVPTESRWPTAPVATLRDMPSRGDAMVTIGCSHGDDPTVERTQLLAVNRYDGPDNFQVDRSPVPGRSGGGLFDRSGRLVGLCIGEFKDTEGGLYAGLAAIHDLLDECRLSSIYRPTETTRESVQVAATPRSEPAAWPAATEPPAKRLDNLATTSATVDNAIADEDEIEMVCIIRSKTNPNGPSRIVILNDVDAKLLERIEGPSSR